MRLCVNGLRLIFEKNKEKPHVDNKASRTRHETPHGFASTNPTNSGELLLLPVVKAFTGAAYLLIASAHWLLGGLSLFRFATSLSLGGHWWLALTHGRRFSWPQLTLKDGSFYAFKNL